MMRFDFNYEDEKHLPEGTKVFGSPSCEDTDDDKKHLERIKNKKKKSISESISEISAVGVILKPLADEIESVEPLPKPKNE